jgi:glycosyltransferase involved in cell wall biosynthesis
MGDFELLLTDDGSTDTSARIADSYATADSRVRLLGGSSNLGLVARLNQGVELAKGEFIARMDGDDLSYSHRFAVQLAYLEKHQDVPAVSSAHKFIDGRGVVTGMYKPAASDFGTAAQCGADRS